MLATTILDLATLTYEPRHVPARKACVHQTDDVQVNVYILEPGGCIPAHQQSTSWDISFVIESEIEARFTEHGRERTLHCGSQATQPAKFPLIQSPSRSFDFVRAGQQATAVMTV
jgi:hypothetical protein